MSSLADCARVKRILLSREEENQFESRARILVTQSGCVEGDLHLEPLALSDVSQTYRVRGLHSSFVLKIMPVRTTDLCVRAHEYIRSKGISLPEIVWWDAKGGAVLYEDLGPADIPPTLDLTKLKSIVRYLARLHDACTMTQSTAASLFPAAAADGFPTPAQRAANILHRFADVSSEDGRKLMDAAAALASSGPAFPDAVLVVSDVKLEHFLFDNREPRLVDLEMLSFWDLPISNLATLFSFPGQFSHPLSEPTRKLLLAEYVKERQLPCPAFDVLRPALEAAEFLLRKTFARAASAGAAETGLMVRNRRLRSAVSGDWSLEGELGPIHFGELLDMLSEGRSMRILDLGCGTGAALRDIQKEWPHHHLVGLDRNLTRQTPGAVIADAERLPFAPGQYDIVLCIQVLQYLPDKLRFLEKTYELLSPGGKAFFAMTEHFNGESGFQPPLAEILATSRPRDVQAQVITGFVSGRRVTSFVIVGSNEPLRFPFELESLADRTAPDATFPYLQSRYRTMEL